jgi:hypothetical protein
MGSFAGPEIVTNGLVMAYDMGNTDKSFRGAPTTNLAKNASNVIDWSVSALTQSVTRTTITTNEVYRITSTSGTGSSFRIRFDNATLVNGATYTISYRYKIISGGPQFNANDWCDTSITRVTTALPNSVFYETATGTRATYDSTYRFLDFEMSNNTVVEIWDLQLEERSFATPYSSNQIRSNTQSLLDLARRNTLTSTSLTYASNGTFSFNGTSDVIGCGNDASINFDTGNFTVSAWFKRATNATTNLRLLSKGADSDTASRAGFAFVGGDNDINFTVNPNGTRTTIAAASYVVGEWVNVVGLVERGVTMRSYKNGNLVGSAAAPVGSVSGSLSLFIGNNVGSNLYWPGEIAQVSIYNRALTVAEIKQNFEAARGRYGI